MFVSSSCVREGLGVSEALATGAAGRTGAFNSWAMAGARNVVRFSIIQPATAAPNSALTAQQTIVFFMAYCKSKGLRDARTAEPVSHPVSATRKNSLGLEAPQ